MSGIVITPNTPLFHKLGECLRRFVSLADDTEDLDWGLGQVVKAAREPLAEYEKVRDIEFDTRNIRLNIVEDIMDLLDKNQDVRQRFYKGMGPDHFEKFPDGELVEMYKNFEPKRAAQGLPPVGRERSVAWLRHLQKSGHNLVALWNGNVIGHSMLCPMERQRAEFAIFLHQDFRNQGIGTGLTEVTLNYARLKGLRNVWLSVEVNNHCAIRVYKKKGFRVSEIFGPEQEMALDLEKTKGNEVNAHEPAA